MDNSEHTGAQLIAQLEELVLRVMEEARVENELLGPTEISKRAGIYLEETDRGAWVGFAILTLLETKDLVRRLPGGRWEPM